jgi:hypothetical protein
MVAELSQLRAALPGYDVVVTRRNLTYRLEAIRRPDGPQEGPWCVVTTDPADLWRELAPWTRAGAGTRTLPIRAS